MAITCSAGLCSIVFVREKALIEMTVSVSVCALNAIGVPNQSSAMAGDLVDVWLMISLNECTLVIECVVISC